MIAQFADKQNPLIAAARHDATVAGNGDATRLRRDIGLDQSRWPTGDYKPRERVDCER